jgi:hypothetical protein
LDCVHVLTKARAVARLSDLFNRLASRFCWRSFSFLMVCILLIVRSERV